jgi:outer membrane usher protein
MAGSPVHVLFASGALLLLACQLQAKEAFFNPALLEIDHPAGIDIHQFNRANNLPPGTTKWISILTGKC